jgi:hypothetical protein
MTFRLSRRATAYQPHKALFVGESFEACVAVAERDFGAAKGVAWSLWHAGFASRGVKVWDSRSGGFEIREI